MEVGQHAVTQHRVRDRANVLEADVVAATRQRARLAAEHQELRGADAGTERDPFRDVRRAGRRLRPAGPNQRQGVAHDRIGHRHAAHQALERHEVCAGHWPLERRLENRRRRLDDHELFFFGRMVHHDVEHEAVQLRFRQRIRALELDRVLRREDVERLFELVGAALDGDAVFLHGFQQCGLRLGRRAVDFVGQHDVGENRSRREHHLAAAGGGVFLDDVGAGDVRGHQVGCELDARELQVQHARHGVDQQRLRQAGHADDQAVATDEQRQQHLVDHLVLPDDQLFQLADDLFATILHAIGQRQIVRRVHVNGFHGGSLHC